MDTVSWYAVFPLRMRVSMSAIGSVIVMAVWPFSPWYPPGAGPAAFVSESEGGLGYQLDLVTPGSSPRWAISRTQIRHRPNLR